MLCFMKLMSDFEVNQGNADQESGGLITKCWEDSNESDKRCIPVARVKTCSNLNTLSYFFLLWSQAFQ